MPRGSRAAKRSEWQERLRQYSRSKLSVTEFCRQERVSAPSFYQWRRKLADTRSDASSKDSATRPRFVPVEVSRGSGLHASFPNGAQVALTVSDAEIIRLALETIAQAGTSQDGR